MKLIIHDGVAAGQTHEGSALHILIQAATVVWRGWRKSVEGTAAEFAEIGWPTEGLERVDVVFDPSLLLLNEPEPIYRWTGTALDLSFRPNPEAEAAEKARLAAEVEQKALAEKNAKALAAAEAKANKKAAK
jgi:hypothetical protein